MNHSVSCTFGDVGISFAIFLKFILLMILVTSFQNSEGDWRSTMITDWSKMSQPMLLGSVAIGGITQVNLILYTVQSSLILGIAVSLPIILH